MDFDKLKSVMKESLQNPDKKLLLPYGMRKYNFTMNPYSNLQILITYFAHWIDIELKKEKEL